MSWQVVLMVVIAVPVILLPVAVIWYLNFGGIYHAIQESRARRLLRNKAVKVQAEVQDK